jgi:RNase P/RNase MRP subunit POP5
MVKVVHQRYILFEIFTKEAITFEEKTIINSIWKQLIKTFGEKTSFLAGLWLVKWDSSQNIGILRLDNITKNQVISAMALIKRIGQCEVIFHTRKTTGTIKKSLQQWKLFFKDH